jgi:hypothetical protein
MVVMLRLRLIVAVVLAVAMALSFTASASADPKFGCPAAEDWGLWGVQEAAEEIFPNLLPGLLPFETVEEVAEVIDAVYDNNDDGNICLKIIWGDDLNPNSHWYKVGVELLGSPTIMYILRDNTANE